MNSIANEIWAIGREHFVRGLQGPDPVAELVREARERFGRCDVLVARAEPEVDGVAAVLMRETVEATMQAVLAAVGARAAR
jgi:hypothetical protein